MSNVDHPWHYGGKDHPYEVIKVIDAWGLSLSFSLGNAVKYIARASHKGNFLEDLEKARWYLDHEIERIKSNQALMTSGKVRTDAHFPKSPFGDHILANSEREEALARVPPSPSGGVGTRWTDGKSDRKEPRKKSKRRSRKSLQARHKSR